MEHYYLFVCIKPIWQYTIIIVGCKFVIIVIIDAIYNLLLICIFSILFSYTFAIEYIEFIYSI